VHGECAPAEAAGTCVDHAGVHVSEHLLGLIGYAALRVDAIPPPLAANALKEMPFSHVQPDTGTFSLCCK
jgi:hypothetical protein